MIAEELGIARSTAWRALKKAGRLPARKKRAV
jgi:predicted DNA binding protein